MWIFVKAHRLIGMVPRSIDNILTPWECPEATPHLPEEPEILDQFEGESAELAISATNSGLSVTAKVHALIVSVSIFVDING